MSTQAFTTREQVYDYLDEYALGQRVGLGRLELPKDAGLIKSYIIETESKIDEGSTPDIPALLQQDAKWTLRQVEDNALFYAVQGLNLVGFIETLSNRHFAIHALQTTQVIDKQIKNVINNSTTLDSMWLSGNYLELIWQNHIKGFFDDSFVAFKFRYKSFFEDWEAQDEDSNGDVDDEDEVLERESTSIPRQQRASTVTLKHRVNRVAGFLPQLQAALPDFKAIEMLRVPNEIGGASDFWDWGKITHRSSSFRSTRGYINFIVEAYQQVTETIEEKVWLQLEKSHPTVDDTTLTLRGTPVSFLFPEPLEKSIFQSFVDSTFNKGHGPFRLWGKLIALGESKFHIYGLDLHLWQRIYLELTPQRFVVILPQNTCGNTVHRMLSNIQRYLSPRVEAYIGEFRYVELVETALRD